MRRKYRYINQSRNNCFAVCLEMILERRGILGFNQYKIADFFNRNKNGGLSISDINKQFFIPNNIMLKEKFFAYNNELKYDEELDIIYDRFKNSDNDYLVFTNFSTLTKSNEEVDKLYKTNDEKIKVHHCFLIEGIKDKDTVVLVSPETGGNGGTTHITTSLNKIYESMYKVRDSKAGLGISEISKKY